LTVQKVGLILWLGWLVALISRYLFARGEVPILAYLSFVGFWLLTAAILVRSVSSLARNREETGEHVLILGAFLAISLRAFVTEGVAAHLLSLSFFGCVVGLALYYVRQWWMRIGLGSSSSK